MGKGMLIATLLGLGLMGSDALAFSMGGGSRGGYGGHGGHGRSGGHGVSGRGTVVSGRKGVTKSGRNSVKRGLGASGYGYGSGNGGKHDGSSFKKWPLPAVAEAASLDTSKFDAIASSLKLRKAQIEKIDQARNEILAEGKRLASAQDKARRGYERALGQASSFDAARQVMRAAQAVRRYDPNRRFGSALAKILHARQWSKYRDAPARAKG